MEERSIEEFRFETATVKDELFEITKGRRMFQGYGVYNKFLQEWTGVGGKEWKSKGMCEYQVE